LTITNRLAGFLTALDYDSLSQEVINATKDCILDTLGCILAGAKVKNMPKLVKELTAESLQKKVTILGYGRKASLFTAGLLNGMMGHAVEMDDVHKLAKSHAGTVVIPTALSYGEWGRVSGKDLILSVVVGYEAMLRIGTAINATAHRLQGWHATGTCGAFGAAATAAKLAKLSQKKFVSALGLAGTQSSGLWAFTADGADCKMFHAGHAVTNGLMATKLTLGGLTGPSQIIEAKDGGLFKASSSEYDFSLVTDKLGESFTITQVARKPFACCRSMHPSIEAALRINQRDLNLDQIKHIKVNTYKVAKVQCGFTNQPKNTAEARFSIPYGIAVALYDGKALLDQFSECRIRDPLVLRLAEKVEIDVNERFDLIYPDKWGCSLEITMESGETYFEAIEDAKGDPDTPLSAEELNQKFLYLAEGCIGRERALKIIEKIIYLEEINDIGELIKLCSRG
jgi:2-methylcitrate dehydratase PrpD